MTGIAGTGSDALANRVAERVGTPADGAVAAVAGNIGRHMQRILAWRALARAVTGCTIARCAAKLAFDVTRLARHANMRAVQREDRGVVIEIAWC